VSNSTYSIPTSWEWKRLGDISKIITKGTTPTTLGFEFQNYAINFIKIESISDTGQFLPEMFKHISTECNETLSRSKLEKNDILFSIAGALGRAALVTDEILPANINQALAIIRFPDNIVDYQYLFFTLKSSVVFKQFEKFKRGNSQKNLSLDDVRNFNIPIPPLEEQKRIAKTIEAKLAAFEKARMANNEQLIIIKKLFKTYINNIFMNSNFPSKQLGDIGNVSMCKRIFKEQTENNGDVPFYKIGTFGKTADAFISEKLFNEYKKKYPYPKKGDVLISASGTIGRAVIYNGEKAYYQDSNIVWINNDESQVLNKYLFYLYLSQPFKPTSGSTITRLYNDDVRKTIISFPSIEEQNHLLRNIELIQNNIENIKSKLCEQFGYINALPSSILRKAFNGEY
jgi:type I restriction enzyme S subunit